MPCNCGSTKKPNPARGSLYVLTLPTGRKKTYSSQDDANRAKARLGGEVSVRNR